MAKKARKKFPPPAPLLHVIAKPCARWCGNPFLLPVCGRPAPYSTYSTPSRFSSSAAVPGRDLAYSAGFMPTAARKTRAK